MIRQHLTAAGQPSIMTESHICINEHHFSDRLRQHFLTDIPQGLLLEQLSLIVRQLIKMMLEPVLLAELLHHWHISLSFDHDPFGRPGIGLGEIRPGLTNRRQLFLILTENTLHQTDIR